MADPIASMAVDEQACAALLGVSVDWLRKDRRNARVVPFFRLGKFVRYDLTRVQEALRAREEGGQRGRQVR